jgi:hypothetical protein
MQSERATGRLSLEAGEGSCSLFFLYGHLFHATGPDVEGEAVVLRALSWTRGNYHYDRRAKLTAKETVRSSPAELIAAAEATDQSAAVAAGFASAPPSLHPIERGAGPLEAPACRTCGAELRAVATSPIGTAYEHVVQGDWFWRHIPHRPKPAKYQWQHALALVLGVLATVLIIGMVIGGCADFLHCAGGGPCPPGGG